MLRFFPVLALGLVFALGGAVADEAEITPEEVTAPSVDWDGCEGDPWCGNPPPWFEDPATVDCGDRSGCWAALGEKTAGEPCGDKESCAQAIREAEARS